MLEKVSMNIWFFSGDTTTELPHIFCCYKRNWEASRFVWLLLNRYQRGRCSSNRNLLPHTGWVIAPGVHTRNTNMRSLCEQPLAAVTSTLFISFYVNVARFYRPKPAVLSWMWSSLLIHQFFVLSSNHTVSWFEWRLHTHECLLSCGLLAEVTVAKLVIS